MDLIGATNLIPGPNSTELAIHLGFERGGGLGLLVGGISFIFPAMLITLFFAYIYVRFGNIPLLLLSGILDGVNLGALALMAVVTVKLGKSSLIDPLSIFIFLISLFTLIKLKINPPWIIVLGGIIGLISSFI